MQRGLPCGWVGSLLPSAATPHPAATPPRPRHCPPPAHPSCTRPHPLARGTAGARLRLPTSPPAITPRCEALGLLERTTESAGKRRLPQHGVRAAARGKCASASPPKTCPRQVRTTPELPLARLPRSRVCQAWRGLTTRLAAATSGSRAAASFFRRQLPQFEVAWGARWAAPPAPRTPARRLRAAAGLALARLAPARDPAGGRPVANATQAAP